MTGERVIDGAKELAAKLETMTKLLDLDESRNAFLAAARTIRDAVKREAPVARWPIVSLFRGRGDNIARRERGSLRRSIVAWAWRRRRGVRRSAGVQVNVRWGLNRAPHGGLVEWGVRERRSSGKPMAFPAMRGRGWIFARRVRAVAPNPYFRRGVEKSAQAALDAATRKMQRIIEGLS